MRKAASTLSVVVILGSTMILTAPIASASCQARASKTSTSTTVEIGSCYEAQGRIKRVVNGSILTYDSAIASVAGQPKTVSASNGYLYGNYYRQRDLSGWTGFMSF